MAWDAGSPTWRQLLRAVYALCELAGVDPPPPKGNRQEFGDWIASLDERRPSKNPRAAA